MRREELTGARLTETSQDGIAVFSSKMAVLGVLRGEGISSSLFEHRLSRLRPLMQKG
jgi:hypothetical protein